MLLATVAAIAQTTFITPTYTPGCSTRLTPDGQNHIWTCWPMGTSFSDGTFSYTGFYVTLAKDGTFTGTFYSDYGVGFSMLFTGTWQGTQVNPIEIDGVFVGGFAKESMGLIQRGGYKGTKIYVWSVITGNGDLT